MKLIKLCLRCSRTIGFSGRILAVVIIASVIGGVSNTIALALINFALSPERLSSPRSLIWSFVGICFLIAISKATAQILLIRFAANTALNLRLRLSRQILAAPLRQMEEIGFSRLLATLTDDIPTLTMTLTNIPSICINLVVVAGCLIYMGWLSWILLLVVIGVVGCGVLGYHLLGRSAYNHFKVARNAWDLLLKHFHALIEGSKELKLHRRRREEFFSQDLALTAASLAHHRVKGSTKFAIAENWSEILIFLVIGLILFGLTGFDGSASQIRTGYVLAILYIMAPLQVLLNSIPMIGQSEISLNKFEEIQALLTSQAREAEASRPSETALFRESLELVNVRHSYYRELENSSFTFGPVDLMLQRGELVFVIGGNGSGKTTFVKILTGLYPPETGEIRLDGEVITDADMDDYRQRFSAVFSDFYLFDRLLGLGNPELDSKARQYLTQLQLNHKVQIEDGKLSTTDLSHGQRKRLALLVSYLEDRPIYVFDEWAADQDPLFKETFYYQLLPELKAKDKTVIVISHDDQYYHVADRIIKLNYGKIESDRRTPFSQDAGLKIPVPAK